MHLYANIMQIFLSKSNNRVKVLLGTTMIHFDMKIFSRPNDLKLCNKDHFYTIPIATKTQFRSDFKVPRIGCDSQYSNETLF